MTDAEINKYIHVEVLGQCWHEIEDENPHSLTEFNCKHCDLSESIMLDRESFINPDYTDDRNLHLLREAELRTIAEKGEQAYWDALEAEFDWPRDGGTDYVDELQMVVADAKKRSNAVVNCGRKS